MRKWMAKSNEETKMLSDGKRPSEQDPGDENVEM